MCTLLINTVKRLRRTIKIKFNNYSYELFSGMNSTEKEIFNLLQKRGAMSKSEISNIAGIKLTTLNRIMEPLETNRILVQYCIGESTGGRKPIVYNINLCNFYIIGINISAEKVEIVFTNLKLEILHKEMFKMNYSFTSEKVLDYIVKSINKVYIELNLDFLSLFGIGVSVQGSFDRKSGVMHEGINMWSDIKIKNILEEKFGVHVVIENGANAAAEAEYFYGLKTEFRNMTYIHCGKKFRTGIIVDGKIFRMLNNDENAFGHMIIDRSKFGCISDYSSIDSIVEQFILKLKKGRNSIINKPIDEITCKDIWEAAELNDELSIEIVRKAAIALGIGLINLIQMFNLKAVVLNGEIISYSKIFYDTCVGTVLKSIKSKIIFKRNGYLKEDAMAVGAAAVVIEKYLED